MGTGAAALSVLGLLSVFSGGDGIRCHICNSDQDEGCSDPFNAAGDPVACDDKGRNDAKCLKVIYAVKGKKLTERGCTVNPLQTVTCNDVIKAIRDDNKDSTNFELGFCETCDRDGCNTAAPRGPSLAASGLLPLAAVLASLRGFL